MRCFISPTIFRFPEVDRIHRELKKKPFKKTLQYIWNKQHKDFYVNEFFKVLFSHQWTYFHNFAQLLCENLYFKFMACAMIFGIKSDSFQAFLFASLNIVACKIYWCPLFFHCQVGMITNWIQWIHSKTFRCFTSALACLNTFLFRQKKSHYLLYQMINFCQEYFHLRSKID